MARIKMSDIAKGANVSISTASRYLNGTRVRSSSASRIEKYLAKHQITNYSGFFRNKGAAAAKGQVIGLIIPTLRSFYYSDTLVGVFDAANKYGYSVMLALAHLNPDTERMLLTRFSKYDLTGLIYSPVAVNLQIPAEIENFKNISVVIANRRNILPGRVHVYADNIKAGYFATRHLLSLGKRKIGFILGVGGNPFDSATVIEMAKDYNTLSLFVGVDRFRGYLKALEEYKIPFSPSLLSVTNWDSEVGGRSALEIVGKVSGLDGLIATSDLLAADALDILQKHGYNIPQDISIIGWGNTEVANYTAPTLTSIVDPAYEIGYSSLSVINRQLQGEQVQDIIIGTSIVQRNSTATNR